MNIILKFLLFPSYLSLKLFHRVTLGYTFQRYPWDLLGLHTCTLGRFRLLGYSVHLSLDGKCVIGLHCEAMI